MATALCSSVKHTPSRRRGGATTATAETAGVGGRPGGREGGNGGDGGEERQRRRRKRRAWAAGRVVARAATAATAGRSACCERARHTSAPTTRGAAGVRVRRRGLARVLRASAAHFGSDDARCCWCSGSQARSRSRAASSGHFATWRSSPQVPAHLQRAASWTTRPRQRSLRHLAIVTASPGASSTSCQLDDEAAAAVTSPKNDPTGAAVPAVPARARRPPPRRARRSPEERSHRRRRPRRARSCPTPAAPPCPPVARRTIPDRQPPDRFVRRSRCTHVTTRDARAHTAADRQPPDRFVRRSRCTHVTTRDARAHTAADRQPPGRSAHPARSAVCRSTRHPTANHRGPRGGLMIGDEPGN